MNSKLLRTIHMNCPLCGSNHEVEERTRTAHTLIKGERVEYEETYYVCCNEGEDENEFTTGRMENDNLMNARNAYRSSHGLLTSSEIVEIREQYGLSQADMARLLGWGEATISRYESKAIQDEAYDLILRTVHSDSLVTLMFLNKNREKFSAMKALEIQRRILANLNSNGKEYLQRKALESEYADYQEPCDANGYTILDIRKLETIISYFAKRIPNLYKVKLMKLLWYADTLSLRETGSSMTGLVYLHESMGALPIGHYKIMGLENILVQEEEGYEYTKYRLLPNENIDETSLTAEERAILDRVIEKFRNYSAKEIADYMHEETAYLNTSPLQVIPFSLAREIREF